MSLTAKLTNSLLVLDSGSETCYSGKFLCTTADFFMKEMYPLWRSVIHTLLEYFSKDKQHHFCLRTQTGPEIFFSYQFTILCITCSSNLWGHVGSSLFTDIRIKAQSSSVGLKEKIRKLHRGFCSPDVLSSMAVSGALRTLLGSSRQPLKRSDYQ